MTQHTISLIDVLTPPENRWLKELSRQKVDLPVGVRVIRFGSGDDGADAPDDGVGTINPRSLEDIDSTGRRPQDLSMAPAVLPRGQH